MVKNIIIYILFIALLSNSILAVVDVPGDLPTTSAPGETARGGFLINTTSEVTLDEVGFDILFTGDTCELFYRNETHISNSAIVDFRCSLSNITLLPTEEYYIMGGSLGDVFTVRYQASITGYPYSGTNVNFIAKISYTGSAFGEATNQVVNIINITTTEVGVAETIPPLIIDATCTSCSTGTNISVDSTPTINVTCTDVGGTCILVRISNDSSLSFDNATSSRNCTAGNGNIFVCTLPTSDQLTNYYNFQTLYFWGLDDSGNNHTVYNLTIDVMLVNNEPTTPSISSPANGEVNDIINIEFSSTDPNNDSIVYDIYINDTLNFSGISTNITGWNASEGTYSLKVTARDFLNSSDNSSEIIFTKVFPKNVSVKHFDLEIGTFVVDGITPQLFFNGSVNLTQAAHVIFRGGAGALASTVVVTDLYMRIDVGGVTKFDEVVISVANDKKPRVWKFPQFDADLSVGSNNVLVFLYEIGAGTVLVDQLEIHSLLNISSVGNGIQHRSDASLDGTFNSLTFVEIDRDGFIKAFNSSTYVDLDIRFFTDDSDTIPECYLQNINTSEITAISERYLSLASEIGSSAIGFVSSIPFGSGREDWALFCLSNDGDDITVNATLTLLEMRDSRKNPIHNIHVFGSGGSESGLGNVIAEVNNFRLENGSEIECSWVAYIESTSGKQDGIKSPIITFDSVNESVCITSYDRSLDASLQPATIMGITSCDGNLEIGKSYDFNLTLDVISPGVITVINASISCIEVEELSIVEGNAPPNVAILNPEDNDKIRSIVNFSSSLFDPNNDSVLSNVTITNSTINIVFSRLNLIGENFTFNTSSLIDGQYNLTWVVFENETALMLSDTEIHNFTIDNTLPSFSNDQTNVTDALQAGNTFQFNITVFDINFIHTITFSWNDSGDFVNTTILINGTSKNVTAIINKTTGLASGTIGYIWYVNDTVGNTNQTQIITFTTSDPTIRLDGLNESRVYEYETTVLITSNVGEINILDGTNRYLDIMPPFNYTLDLLRLNRFSDGSTSKNSSINIYSDPISNESNDWEHGDYTDIDNEVRQPNIDSIDSDQMDDGIGANATFIMENISLSNNTATKITIWVYAQGNIAGDTLEVDLYINGSWRGNKATGLDTTKAWYSANYSGSWNESDIDDMKTRVISIPSGDRVDLFELYAEVSYPNNITIEIDNRSDLYNASFNITGYDSPIDLPLYYGNLILFPGTLLGTDLFQDRFIFSNVVTNIINLSLTAAGSRTIFINFSNQGNYLTRVGKLDFTINAFDLDIGNDFDFTEDFTDSTHINLSSLLNISAPKSIFEDFESSTPNRWVCTNVSSCTSTQCFCFITIGNDDDYWTLHTRAVWGSTGDRSETRLDYDAPEITLENISSFNITADWECSWNLWNGHNSNSYNILKATDGTNTITLITHTCSDRGHSFNGLGPFSVVIHGYRNSDGTWDIYENNTLKRDDVSFSTLSSPISLQFNLIVQGSRDTTSSGSGSASATWRIYNFNTSGLRLRRDNGTFDINVSAGCFESNTLKTGINDISRAFLTITEYNTEDTTIAHYLSNNNGSTYEIVVPNTFHTFTSTGKALKVKLCLNSTDNLTSPFIPTYRVQVIPESPEGLSIDIGNNGILDMEINYTLNSTTTPLNYTGDDSSFNDYINDSCQSSSDCSIPITFILSSGGTIQISNLNVTQDINPIRLNTSVIQDLSIIRINTTSSVGIVQLDDLKFDYRGRKNITVETSDHSLNSTIFVMYSPFNVTILPQSIAFWNLGPNIYSTVQNNIPPFGNANGDGNPFYNITRRIWDRPIDIYIRFNESIDSCQTTWFDGFNNSDNTTLSKTINTSSQLIVDQLEDIQANISTLTNISCAAENSTLLFAFYCWNSMDHEAVLVDNFDTNCDFIN